MAETGVSSVAVGYERIRCTSDAHCLTGHRVVSFVAHCVMVLNFRRFFCDSNVMDTLCAHKRSVDE